MSLSTRTLVIAAAAVIVGTTAALFGTRWLVRPRHELARLRYEAMADMLALYDLQLKYKAVHSRYANGLDTLLSGSPREAALRRRLAEHVDLNTVAVVDLGDKFKIEINVRDADRTLMKIKGPPSAPPR